VSRVHGTLVVVVNSSPFCCGGCTRVTARVPSSSIAGSTFQNSLPHASFLILSTYYCPIANHQPQQATYSTHAACTFASVPSLHTSGSSSSEIGTGYFCSTLRVSRFGRYAAFKATFAYLLPKDGSTPSRQATSSSLLCHRVSYKQALQSHTGTTVPFCCPNTPNAMPAREIVVS
jgi:hypothetical protein